MFESYFYTFFAGMLGAFTVLSFRNGVVFLLLLAVTIFVCKGSHETHKNEIAAVKRQIEKEVKSIQQPSMY